MPQGNLPKDSDKSLSMTILLILLTTKFAIDSPYSFIDLNRHQKAVTSSIVFRINFGRLGIPLSYNTDGSKEGEKVGAAAALPNGDTTIQ